MKVTWTSMEEAFGPKQGSRPCEILQLEKGMGTGHGL